MAHEILVGVKLHFNDKDPDNFAIIERNVPERLRDERDPSATTIAIPRSLCARIAAHFNWVKAKENDPEFQKWLESECGVMLDAQGIDDVHVLTSAVDAADHEHDVSRMIDEGGPAH